MTNMLEIRNVSKRFPGVLALDSVDFDLAQGEVHALLGENGAGKSTLVKIITGAYQKDSGSIKLADQILDLRSPADAQHVGIGIVYQEFSLVPSLSVTENLFLGDLPKTNGLVTWRSAHQHSRALLERFGIATLPTTKVGSLGVAARQMIEILKVIRRSNLKVLILDEPTSSLSDGETQVLFNFIRSLKSLGVSVIYISHRLDEIKQICDRVTVFRNGKKVSTSPAAKLSIKQIISLMIGGELKEQFPAKVEATKDRAIQVETLSGSGFEGVSFSAARGEVLGITGLVGAGKTELLETIYGARRSTSGKVSIEGREIRSKIPRGAIDRGMGLLPESRKEQGLVLSLSCQQNISLASLAQLSRPLLKLESERREAKSNFLKLGIRPDDPQNKVVALSGGNQQKVVLAKWLMRASNIFLFDEPTRGIDVGAKFQIYSLIMDLARAGKTVIVSSSEVEEISGICTRVLVMRRGRIVDELTGSQVERSSILSAIAGAE